MYGLIHSCVKEWVIAKYGHRKWKTILELSGVDEEKTFLNFQCYSDTSTMEFISVVIEELGITEWRFLESVGEHFVDFTIEKGYGEMLHSLGRDFHSFLDNLDYLHCYLMNTAFPGIVMPSFACTQSQTDPQVLFVDYYSRRKGLQALAIGALKGCASRFYNLRVRFEVVQTVEEPIGDNEIINHITFKVTQLGQIGEAELQPKEKNIDFITPSQSISKTSQSPPEPSPTPCCPHQVKVTMLENSMPKNCINISSGNRKIVATLATPEVESPIQDIDCDSAATCSNIREEPSSTANIVLNQCEPKHSEKTEDPTKPDISVTSPEIGLITAETFSAIHPYHFIFDRNLMIRQFGVGIRLLCPEVSESPVAVNSLMDLVWPYTTLNFDNLQRFKNLVFQFLIVRGTDKTTGTVLKGQIRLLSGDLGVFLGTPAVNSLQELAAKSLKISDIPCADSARELILLKHQRSTEFDLMQRLEATTAELKRTAAALEREKGKTDSLLHSMLPPEVAHKLKLGEKVQESFDSATILFSDIVTFTTIASRCQPHQIVALLNDMYTRYDSATEHNKVYKVETIGDAYMVVGGVPCRINDHATRVLQQAMDMVRLAREVSHPISGEPVQIRVGIHTGPTVAGVVGHKMPRYCLFGDSVNVASRMESHGVPGRIHISTKCKRKLEMEGCQLKFEDRGAIEIKGKGRMETFFLALSNDDDFKDHHQSALLSDDQQISNAKVSVRSAPDELYVTSSKTCIDSPQSNGQVSHQVESSQQRGNNGDAKNLPKMIQRERSVSLDRFERIGVHKRGNSRDRSSARTRSTSTVRCGDRRKHRVMKPCRLQ